MAGQRPKLFRRKKAACRAPELAAAIALASEAAEVGRKIGLFGARMALQSGNSDIFDEAAAQGLRCGDWTLELSELPGMEARGPEVLEMCAAALQDIARAYTAAARAIKVTEAVKGTQLMV